MSRPWKHPKTGIYQLRKAVPDDLRKIVGKREEKVSLQTRDPGEAKQRFAKALRFFSRERVLSARLRPLAKANIQLIADHITYITRASRIRRAGAARDH